MNVRRPLHGPYFFELFALANFLVIGVLVLPITPAVFTTLPTFAMQTIGVFIVETVLGVLVRLAVGWHNGTARSYFAIVRSKAWLLDTARLIVFAIVITDAYGWIKLMIPFLHQRLYDQQLWNLETAVCGGYSPTVLLLSLFSSPVVVRFVDASYSLVFFLTMTVAYSFILSAPGRRLRVAFSDSNALLWLLGAWIYVAVPAFGPAYRFPEIWKPVLALMPHTQYAQHALLENYRLVLSRASHSGRAVDVLLGIAAFPSLHVAFAIFVLLWMRKLWRRSEVIFVVFAILIFVGSIVTGWHYLVDGIAGVALALFAYGVIACWRHIGRFAALSERLERPQAPRISSSAR